MSDNGVYKFQGKFADYMSEASRATPIQLDMGTEIIVLPIPTRKQLMEYWAVRADDDLSQTAEPGEAYSEYAVKTWRALIGDHLADKVLSYFEDRSFVEFAAFKQFCEETWFGRGADDVEGK